jgi:hypothetical protein
MIWLRPLGKFVNVVFAALLAVLLAFGGPYLLHQLSLTKVNTIANALLADMLITFPAVFYWFVVRPLQLRKWTMMLVFTCCCGVAYCVLPAQQRQYVLQIRKLSIVAELGVVAYALSKVRTMVRKYRQLQVALPDAGHHLQQSVITVLGSGPAVRMLACELSILRYGLFCWYTGTTVPLEANRFSTHREAGYAAIWSVLFGVSTIEIFSVHLLLMNYSHLAAVIVTAISVYGIVFIIADLSAIVKNPVVVLNNQLLLRMGLRWRLLTTPNNVACITPVKSSFEPCKDCFRGAVFKSAANVYIQFKQPVTVSRLYRKPLQVSRLVISIDDAAEFIAVVQGQ